MVLVSKVCNAQEIYSSMEKVVSVPMDSTLKIMRLACSAMNYQLNVMKMEQLNAKQATTWFLMKLSPPTISLSEIVSIALSIAYCVMMKVVEFVNTDTHPPRTNKVVN